ncbi:MAG: FkbM family methyltransferase [Ruminococcus sp.]|nr:FkbM family methyltransferase [Ruminococcus sp.]
MFTKELLSKKSSWEFLQSTDSSIILYGTGNGADKVLDKFAKLGIKIKEVAASQNFVRKRDFRGYTVKPINEILNEYHNPVIALGFATSVSEVIEEIKALCKTHKVIMPVVPVFGETVFDREYVENHKEELEKSRSLLFDEESKRVFDNMVHFQFTGNLSYLFSAESSRTDALINILNLNSKEYMLDLGAYRGDTIEELITLTGGYSHITAFEPDRKTFEKLSDYAKNKDNITLYPYAVWKEKKELTFSGGGGRQSTLDEKGKYSVYATDVDSLIKNQTVTYLKADVEGVEEEMLKGAKNLLTNQKPKLSISCYHKTEDLCTLIPLTHNINPEYKIHLRHHPYIPFWDTNLYCI